MQSEKRGAAAVAWMPGTKHRLYEDRYRLLSKDIPMVSKQNRGEIFAVCDGIGSAPRSREAAQEVCDVLVRFCNAPEEYEDSSSGMQKLLLEAYQSIFNWGVVPGTDRPLGGCAGTIIWITDESLYVFHAGDTLGLLIRDGKIFILNRVHAAYGTIYRYFGLGPGLELDPWRFSLEQSDRILLISDGVTKVFHPEEAAPLVEEFDDNRRAVTELVQRSRSLGSTDDITALLVEIEDL